MGVRRHKKYKCGGSHKNYKGGESVANGYKIIHIDTFSPEEKRILRSMAWKNGYMYKHRACAALALGRPIPSHKIVHHNKNNKRGTDLKIEESRGDHMKTHMRDGKFRPLYEDLWDAYIELKDAYLGFFIRR